MKRAVTIAAAAAVTVLAAGCSSQDEGDKGGSGDGGASDTTAAAVQAARIYQSAVNGDDWTKACGLRTERYRHGSVKECVADNAPKTQSPEPSPTESEEFPPLRRADGSVVRGKPKPSATGPDRAETGEVKASAPQSVPAIGDHPAGTGVRVEYTVTWPDSTTTSRKALRVVQQGDTWLVDQSEDIAESDEAHGNPVRDALMRG
ncbi:hypothetical protein RND61_26565 [Streptomyces sp. TRM76323]|uniref:Lipoprotein n=1 Tax=Streptomyces tamarix TaxID=3078565 RepID=A0ABU3QS56_9ACTN|nr:hypothetical protein [Streptomyces tamarix]MDT9685600.1 hypothetical protein [Streptomyces tamarix]